MPYSDGTLSCRGVLFFDEARPGRRPGVVVFPDARGMGTAAEKCARRLATLGLVSLVADLYGNGTFVADITEAQRLMNGLRGDVVQWRKRALAALDALAHHYAADKDQLAAVGYCFGGSTALELARSGAPLKAVTSFHGGLASPRPEDAASIKARVLVCHGAADPLVPPVQVEEFVAQMCRTTVDWRLHVYAGVMHSFTNPEVDAAGLPGQAYNADADRESWQAMTALFDDAFGRR